MAGVLTHIVVFADYWKEEENELGKIEKTFPHDMTLLARVQNLCTFTGGFMALALLFEIFDKESMVRIMSRREQASR